MSLTFLTILTLAHAIEPTVELGVGGGALVPLGDAELRPAMSFLFRTGFWFDSQVGVEAALNLSGARSRRTEDPYLIELAHLSVVTDLLPPTVYSPVHPLVRAGAGVLHAGGGADRLTGLGTAGVGLLAPIIGPVAVRVDVGVLVHGDGADGLRGSLDLGAGVVVRLDLTRDRDKDGLRDLRDDCPTELEDEDGFDDADGCPDPDNDGDGVPDVLDGCPLSPESPDGIEDADGCPEYDPDNDGIFGKRDRCPSQAEDFDGVEDHDGCPEECMATLPPEKGGDPTNFDGCPPDL